MLRYDGVFDAEQTNDHRGKAHGTKKYEFCRNVTPDVSVRILYEPE